MLRDHDEVHERRRQATHPAAKEPELLATKPNQVYSWDITKLLGPVKWTYGLPALVAWLQSLGQLQWVGVEGTGAYGAGLLRHLHQAGVSVVEVDRPDRRTRHTKGKSDPLDAEAAARAALAGTATGIPKGRDGRVEAIRALRVTRRGAMKARTAAGNQLGCLVVSAPEPLRGTLRTRSGKELVGVRAVSSCSRRSDSRRSVPLRRCRAGSGVGRVQAGAVQWILASARPDREVRHRGSGARTWIPTGRSSGHSTVLAVLRRSVGSD